MIKAIFFDMGGVLRDLDMERCKRNYRALGWADIEEYVDSAHQKQFIGDFEKGLIDTPEFVRLCLEHCAPGTTEEQVKSTFLTMLADIVEKQKMDFLKELKVMGYKLFILSNNNPLSSAQFVEKCTEAGLDYYGTFTDTYYSFHLKMMKPSLEIYETTAKMSGFAPEEILFVDDAAHNIEGAKAAGFKTLLFTPGGDLRGEVLKCLEALNSSL